MGAGLCVLGTDCPRVSDDWRLACKAACCMLPLSLRSRLLACAPVGAGCEAACCQLCRPIPKVYRSGQLLLVGNVGASPASVLLPCHQSLTKASCCL